MNESVEKTMGCTIPLGMAVVLVMRGIYYLSVRRPQDTLTHSTYDHNQSCEFLFYCCVV